MQAEKTRYLLTVAFAVWGTACTHTRIQMSPQASVPGISTLSEMASPRSNAARRKVTWWVHYYSVREPVRFRRAMGRGRAMRKSMEEILVAERVPTEFYYLALVESEFSSSATSVANAAGIWQLTPDTAKRYGIRIDQRFDQRREPMLATRAAARHLRRLYSRFGSWELALAAYNAGEGKVSQAIRKGKSRDYWALCAKLLLPSETREYVAKFLAAYQLGETAV